MSWGGRYKSCTPPEKRWGDIVARSRTSAGIELKGQAAFAAHLGQGAERDVSLRGGVAAARQLPPRLLQPGAAPHLQRGALLLLFSFCVCCSPLRKLLRSLQPSCMPSRTALVPMYKGFYRPMTARKGCCRLSIVCSDYMQAVSWLYACRVPSTSCTTVTEFLHQPRFWLNKA